MSNLIKKNQSKPVSKNPQTPLSVDQHHLTSLRQDIDTLFDNVFANFPKNPFGWYGSNVSPFQKLGTALTPLRGLMPSMDVKETDTEYHISAELPGMAASDIDLSLRDGQLVIEGEKQEETKSESEGHRLSERHYGSIYRSLPLPDGVDENAIEAIYDNGVLNVTLKKTKQVAKAEKTIKIKAK